MTRSCSPLPLAGAALAFLLAAHPAAANCDPDSIRQGSYDRESGAFTLGTAGGDRDYRIDCAGSVGEDPDDPTVALTADPTVALTIAGDRLPAGRRPDSLFVMRLSGGPRVNEENAGGLRYVVIPSAAIETGGYWQHGLSMSDTDEFVWVELRGTVTTHAPAAGGMRVSSSATGSAGSATAINRGTITTGGPPIARAEGDATSQGIWVSAAGGDATGENYGAIHTHGHASHGIFAESRGAGAATAINYGTIVNTGPVHEESNGGTPWESVGVFAQAWSPGGGARAANRAGATIRVSGPGGLGLAAHAFGTAEAVSENRGAITVSGPAYEVTNRENKAFLGVLRRSAGVAAFSGGTGRAFAVNHAGGTIDATGRGSPGLLALSYSCDGAEARVENRGTIVTRGNGVTAATSRQVIDECLPAGTAKAVTITSREWPKALRAWSKHGDAYALNDVGGIAETHGARAPAVYAGAHAGSAQTVNKGNVRTHSTVDAIAEFEFGEFRGSHGIYAGSDMANAEAENDATGQVATKGPGAIGVVAETFADGARTSAQARAVNKGRVTTEGRDAEGVAAVAHHGGGTEANPVLATATNAAGATIGTTGDESSGLVAAIEVPEDGTSFGRARAENAGAITASGRAGQWADDEPEASDSGVFAGFYNFTDGATRDGGSATVINSGDVTVTGAGMTGLRALAYGSGTATVEMTGGTVTASAADGIGIWAGTGAAGTARVTVGGGTVRAPVAARLAGGSTRLALANGAFLEGDVSFGDGADTLETAGWIGGDVSFGAGEDMLLLDVREGIAGIEGAITGLEDMIKRGPGTARVNDATFTGSTVVVEQGNLEVRGHLDLGARGTVTVRDAARLTVLIGDIADRATDHGRFTAGGGIELQGPDPAIFASWDPALDEEKRAAAAQVLQTSGIAVAGEGTAITASDADAVSLRTESGSGESAARRSTPTPEEKQDSGAPAEEDGAEDDMAAAADDATGDGEGEIVGTLVSPDSETGATTITLAAGQDLSVARRSTPTPEDGQDSGTPAEGDDTTPANDGAAAAQDDGPEAANDGAAASDDDDDGDGETTALAVGGGLLAAVALFDVFDLFDGMFGDAAPGAGGFAGLSPAPERAGATETGVVWWGRALTGETPASFAGARHGLQMGATARLGDGFHLGLSGMPRMAGEIDDGAFAGHRYTLRGGWESDALFANVDISQGDYSARTTFANLDGLESLSGAFGVRHERARAELGARLDAGRLRLDPSLSLFAGSLDRAAYTAASAALRAEIPAFSQAYDGWKARVSLTPADWLEAGALRWRPELRFATARISTDGPDDLRVRQTDRAGVLGFSTPATVQGLPRAMHAAGAAVSLARGDAWTLRGGYMALVADGDPVHVAAARFRLRF